jgi:hypothetical protein
VAREALEVEVVIVANDVVGCVEAGEEDEHLSERTKTGGVEGLQRA